MDVPSLVVKASGKVVRLLNWWVTGETVWGFGHIHQCSWHPSDWSSAALEVRLESCWGRLVSEGAVHKQSWQEQRLLEGKGTSEGVRHFAEWTIRTGWTQVVEASQRETKLLVSAYLQAVHQMTGVGLHSVHSETVEEGPQIQWGSPPFPAGPGSKEVL